MWDCVKVFLKIQDKDINLLIFDQGRPNHPLQTISITTVILPESMLLTGKAIIHFIVIHRLICSNNLQQIQVWETGR